MNGIRRVSARCAAIGTIFGTRNRFVSVVVVQDR